MSEENLNGYLVFRPENRRYLSGYTAKDTQLDESSGFLFITPRRQFLITDFRYQIQAMKEAQGFEVVLYQTGPAQTAAGLAGRYNIRSLGFEEEIMSVKFHRQLVENLANAQPVPVALVERLRAVKDADEIKSITKALRLIEKVLQRTWDYLTPGKSEIEIARFIDSAMKEYGAEEPAFETIVASGPNAALPHAVPTGRKIKEGETIVIDCGALLNGYRSDITRTIVLGQPEPWIMQIYSVVRQAQNAAIAGIKAGMMSDQADALARDVIDSAGYGPYFGHSLGHGVGLATHEMPSLSKNRPGRLEADMVVTVEPGIYLEGKGGVRLEQMVRITENGCKVINRDGTFYDWPGSD